MKKILIIGAGFLQDFVIQKAKAMGYQTLTVDMDPRAPGFVHADRHAVIDITDEKACLKYARYEKIDGVMTAATDYGVLTASYIARELNLPGLNYEIAKLIKNKYRVRKCLYESSVDDTKQSYEVDDSTDIASLCCQLSFPVMVKPCDGSGSRGATRVDDSAVFLEACKKAIGSSLIHRAVVETFITGEEYGAESLVVNGEVYVLGIIKKWMTDPPYYAELGHAMPNDLSIEVEQRAICCVENAIKALGIDHGSVNMDLLITENGKIHIVDVGARMGGNLIGPCVIPYGTGIDYMANAIRLSVGDDIDLTPVEHGAVATKLLALPSGTVKRLPDFRALEQDYQVEIYHHLAVGQKVKEYHTNLDGCGYIVVKSKDVNEAVRNAAMVFGIIRNCIFEDQ